MDPRTKITCIMGKKVSGYTPLVVYFILAYLISWLIWFPLYSPALGIEGLPALPFQHGIGGLGPMVASFITTGIFEGGKGVKNLASRMVRVRPPVYVAIGLLSPFLLAFIAALISYGVDKHPIQLSGLIAAKEFPQFNFAGFLLYNLLFLALVKKLAGVALRCRACKVKPMRLPQV